MALATYWTAPSAVSTWLSRRVTLRSILGCLCSCGAVFHVYWLARTGDAHLDAALGNLAGSTVL